MGEVATDKAQEPLADFYERLRQQPVGSLYGPLTGRSREEAIDAFLTALSDGVGPYTAAQKAGVLLQHLQEWATDGSENSRIFASQWLHAEQYAREQEEAKVKRLALDGWLEYVTNKDGLVTRRDPITGNWEPVLQRKFDSKLQTFWLEHNMPQKYGKKQAGARDNARDITDFTTEVPTIEPDEPGPASPIL